MAKISIDDIEGIEAELVWSDNVPQSIVIFFRSPSIPGGLDSVCSKDSHPDCRERIDND